MVTLYMYYPAGLALSERLCYDGARAAAPGGRLHAHPPRGRQHRRQAAPQTGADNPPKCAAKAHGAPRPRIGRLVQAILGISAGYWERFFGKISRSALAVGSRAGWLGYEGCSKSKHTKALPTSC